MNNIFELLLNTGWCGAVVMWLHNGQGLKTLSALTPDTWWRAGGKPVSLVAMSDDEFALALITSSRIPFFITKHLLCPYCLSASASAFGLVLLDADINLHSVVVWAASAFFSNVLTKKL
jgi:hypothetical protein